MRPFIFFLIATLFISCADESVDYREKIEGVWQLKNMGELQQFYPANEIDFILKDAQLSFASDGTLESKLMAKDNVTWITEKGTWSMPKEGGVIRLENQGGLFNDQLIIEFFDERTFQIVSNELPFVFVKL